MSKSKEASATPRMPNCPKCVKPLTKIRYPSDSMLNRDQWESQLPGDLFCECHNNHRGNKPYAYFWESEFEAGSGEAATGPTPEQLRVAYIQCAAERDMWQRQYEQLAARASSGAPEPQPDTSTRGSDKDREKHQLQTLADWKAVSTENEL